MVYIYNLTDNTLCAFLSNTCSAIAPVQSGVHKGLVLGPIICTMNIKPMSDFGDCLSIIRYSTVDDQQ